MSIQPPPPGAQRLPPTGPQKDPIAIAIATELRHNKHLKQRQGIVTNTKNRNDFFRFKRFERAILSEEYSKKQAKSSTLPPITNKQEVQQIFIKLIQNQLVLPVIKLKTKDSKSRGISVDKKTPALELTNKAGLQGDEYYVWNYNPPNPYMFLYTILAIVVVFVLILFPLWPMWMRKGVWYISNLALGFIALFFAIALVRLVIYMITLISLKSQLWIFPNLFADCGVLESFQPFYEWTSDSKKKVTKKKNVNEKETNNKPEIVSKPQSTTKGAAFTGASNATTTTRRVATVEEIKDE